MFLWLPPDLSPTSVVTKPTHQEIIARQQKLLSDFGYPNVPESDIPRLVMAPRFLEGMHCTLCIASADQTLTVFTKQEIVLISTL